MACYEPSHLELQFALVSVLVYQAERVKTIFLSRKNGMEFDVDYMLQTTECSFCSGSVQFATRQQFLDMSTDSNMYLFKA